MKSTRDRFSQRTVWTVAALVMLLAVFLVWVRRGPDSEGPPDLEPIPESAVFGNTLMQERMHDPEYVDAIHALTSERRATAARRADILARMEDLADAVEAEMIAELHDAGLETTQIDRVAFEERVRSQPEWTEMEARVDDVQIELNLIQERAYNLVRGRMLAQLDERRVARGPNWRPRPLPVRPEIEKMAMTLEEQLEMLNRPPTIISNVPPHIVERMAPVPERGAVDWWPGKDAGHPFPGQQ